MKRLKASLAEALSSRDGRSFPTFDMDTPAERTLGILDKIMHGESVSAR